MCGICGFIVEDPRVAGATRDLEAMKARVRGMADALAHRGPDAFGVWADSDAGVALGHRRLAILDPSPQGAQPMTSRSGRYTMVYNGEIYNFRALRKDLEAEGASFLGGSDTEVLLEAIASWGLELALERCVGMFGLALWDARERSLALVRDRVGKKPVYYGSSGGHFFFASELKAFVAHPAFRPEIDRDALALLVSSSYIPAPYCIYRGIRKLAPGESIVVDVSRMQVQSRRFWSARLELEAALAAPLELSPEAAVDEFAALLRDAVGLRMIADVELGALLSGGIDSSLIVSIMQSISDRPVKTFCIGFDEASHDESQFAANVARHLGTDHETRIVSAEDAMSVVSLLPRLYDEPFADSSQIPTFLVSELARQDVTVALSGDGGDELFAGYDRYFSGLRRWRRVGWLPRSLRSWVSGVSKGGRRLRGALARDLELLGAEDAVELFALRRLRCVDAAEIVPGATRLPTLPFDRSSWPKVEDPLTLMMFVDFVADLAEDILVKVDRASMSVGLEVRSPLLDHRVVEFVWRLPDSLKVRGTERKWLMRQVLDRHLPRSLTERPKRGFGMPVGDWLRGPMRDWAEDLLGEERLRREGWLEPAAVRGIWDEHLAGTRDRALLLWNLLMFQTWLDAESPGRIPAC